MATRVYLFSYDADVERVCAAAMRSCYSPHAGYSLYTYTGNPQVLEGEKAFDNERVQNLLRKALDLGHHDILEHGLYTFDVQSMSRACSHQFVRHRLASFSQQSQRYVKITRSYGYVKPPSISNSVTVPVSMKGSSFDLNFEDIMDVTRQIEEGYVKLGIKAEDARYVRPNAAATNLVASMNPRQLLHILSLRCASDAQWEIRCVCWAMFACAKLVSPTIFESLPGAKEHPAMLAKIEKLNVIMAACRDKFATLRGGELLEIPLRELGLEYEVQPFVRKV